MLAVLPFENLTGDPNKEYLADGLTEQTISQLGRLNPEQLGVIARTSIMGYKARAHAWTKSDRAFCAVCPRKQPP
jgi:TolB-like protein